MWRDLERTCATLGLPFVRPELFPQNTLLAARVAFVGLKEAWGEDYCRAVYRAEFGEGRSIESPAVIAGILSDLGLELARCLSKPSQTTSSRDFAGRPRTRSNSAYSAHRAF